MIKLKTKHVLTGDELDANEITSLIDLAIDLKVNRYLNSQVLNNKHLALIFEKPSLRTRFSFSVAMHELGGNIVESLNSTRKQEEPEDQIRVLQGYCHGVMIRTHEDSILERMTKVSDIPIINGLTSLYHPCQILADLMSLKEHFGYLEKITISYIGEGNNILHSLLLMATKLGINVHFCCPMNHGPKASILTKAKQENDQAFIKSFDNPIDAVVNASAVYTDVWNSMGFEVKDEILFEGFQINESLMEHAKENAVFMHCMPMERGKEVSQTLPDHPCSIIFTQSENRMHIQKALLLALMS